MSRHAPLTPHDKADLKTLLEYIDLHKTAQNYPDLINQAEKDNWSHLKFLETLASQEVSLKRERAIAHRISHARFPVLKTIDSFDFAFPSSIQRGKVLAALSLEFLDRQEGFVLM